MSKLHLDNYPIKRRAFLAGAAATVGAAVLAACGGTSTASGTPSAGGSSKYTIALILGVKGDPFYVTMQKGAEAKAKELGVTLLVDGPAQWSAALQTPIVDAYRARKVDAIIIAACDKQAMIQPLQQAHDQGIKIISVDTFIGDGDYQNGSVTFPLSYIGSDNTQGGKTAGEALIKAMGGKGKIYIQNTVPGTSTTDQRQQGCQQAITAAGSAVTLVGVDFNGDSASKATEQTAAKLQSTPDLGGIFGTNIFGSEGAAQAVKNANKQGQVKIANFDAPEQAISDLKNNAVDIVIAQKPGDMGSTGVQYAVDALNGKTSDIQKRVATGYVIITRDNVDTPEAQNAIYKSN
jgi:ribose transport system substrate-binding protein